MAGTGLTAQLGFAAESAYGTYGTPSKFMRAKSYPIETKNTRVQGTGIQSGAWGPLAAHYAETTKGFATKISADLQNRGFGLIYQALMGPLTTPSAVVTGSAYGTTFTLGDTLGRYLTFQVGSPLSTGTVTPQNLLGCKVTGFDLKCEATGLASIDIDVDARSHNNATNALVAASFATSTSAFHGGQLAFKMGTYGAEASVPVRSVGVSVKRPHDDQRYVTGASGLKAEPLVNGLTEITLDVTSDFDAVATFQDVSLATTAKSVIVEFTGALLSGSAYDLFRFTIPSVVFEPQVVGVAGVGMLSTSWKAKWVYDGTNLPTIYTVTADAAH